MNNTITQAHISHFVDLLTRVAESNELSLVGSINSSQTVYHSETRDTLASVYDLVTRFDTHLRCSESCYALALIYMDRVVESSSDGLEVNLFTIRRLFTTSLMLANHMLDDIAEQAIQFSVIANIPVKILAQLKVDFVFRIDFKLIATPEELLSFSDTLKGRFSTVGFQQSGLMWQSESKPLSSSNFVEQTPPRCFFPSHQLTPQSIPSSTPFACDRFQCTPSPVTSRSQFQMLPSPCATPSSVTPNATASNMPVRIKQSRGAKRALESIDGLLSVPLHSTTTRMQSQPKAKRSRTLSQTSGGAFPAVPNQAQYYLTSPCAVVPSQMRLIEQLHRSSQMLHLPCATKF